MANGYIIGALPTIIDVLRFYDNRENILTRSRGVGTDLDFILFTKITSSVTVQTIKWS